MEKKITQRKLAKKLGVSESYVSKILNDKRLPTDEQAEKIAKILKTPVEFLFPERN